MMQWEKLLSLQKQGTQIRQRKDEYEERLAFDVDYDRIVFSQPFRSLQDKTQVIPLSKTGFVHTRLTHSMEVSVVGRSLGRYVGKGILENNPNLKDLGYKLTDFGTIVASASLAHDIGNPPFGHSGERAIGDFFKYNEGREIKDYIDEKSYEDFCRFEGNANGFRILTQNNGGAFRLSYATLGTFLKYPKESLPYKPSSYIAFKKYNVFQQDKVFFKELAESLGLISYGNAQNLMYSRHPLAFLVEAADDLCYTIIDFEDGVNMGLIELDTAFDILINFINKDRQSFEKKYLKLSDKQSRIGYLRAVAIGTLVEEVTQIFINNEQIILKGEFDKPLLDLSSFKKEIDQILNISINQIYNSDKVIGKEIQGYAIFQNLLRIYFTAILNSIKGNLTAYDKLILKTLPLQIQNDYKKIYINVMEMVCYLASLTDTQISELYTKKLGII